MDEILFCHSDFLDSCLKDCMLTIPHILATIVKILSICVDFCKFIQVIVFLQSCYKRVVLEVHIRHR